MWNSSPCGTERDMNLSLRQLRAFLAVSELRSFTKASEQLHVTQAGMSAMVRELEAQVGCQLFERTTRIVKLTESGRRLLPVVARAVQELESAMAALGAATEQEQKRLKIGVAPLIASSLLPEVLRRFRAAEPGIEVEVIDSQRDQIQSLVETGEVDAGFGVFFNRVSGFKRQAVFACRLMLLTPRNLASRTKGTTWATLPSEPLIVLPEQNQIQRLVDEQLTNAAVITSKRISLRNLATVIAMVEAGFGVAIVPSFCAWACRRYAVSMTALTDPVVELDFYCITRSGRTAPAGLESLIRSFLESSPANP